jgi:hypothetical protein
MLKNKKRIRDSSNLYKSLIYNSIFYFKVYLFIKIVAVCFKQKSLIY